MSYIITATFSSSISARDALVKLENAGFTHDEISIVSADQSLKESFDYDEPSNSKTAEGAATGGTIGGVLGAVAAGLAATGTIFIPGVNLIVYGSLLAAAAGAGVGAITGGLVGALIGAGIPENEAKSYETAVRNGATLVSVEVDEANRSDIARTIFRQCSAQNIAA